MTPEVPVKYCKHPSGALIWLEKFSSHFNGNAYITNTPYFLLLEHSRYVTLVLKLLPPVAMLVVSAKDPALPLLPVSMNTGSVFTRT